MSNQQTMINLRPPSEAYGEATCSLVYRLSELMFGSLLAAYSLGFVGAIAAHGAQSFAHRYWGMALLAAQYTSISVAFVYLTTSLYVTYHVGILTMPQLPFERLGKDFTVAVLQAVFFGLSMLQPAAFLFLLGINFLISAKRKNQEYKELVSRLYKELCRPRGRNVSADPRFREEVATLLRRPDFSKLSGWAPISRGIRGGTWIAIIVGSALIIWCLLLRFKTNFLGLQNYPVFGLEQPELKWFWQQVPITIGTLSAAGIIATYGWQGLKQRASFLGFPVNNSEHELRPTGEARNLRAKVRVEKAHMKADTGQASNFKVEASYLLDKPKGQGRSQMDKEFEKLQSELRKLCQKLVNAS